jgi:hypothetical protein
MKLASNLKAKLAAMLAVSLMIGTASAGEICIVPGMGSCGMEYYVPNHSNCVCVRYNDGAQFWGYAQMF